MSFENLIIREKRFIMRVIKSEKSTLNTFFTKGYIIEERRYTCIALGKILKKGK